MNRKATAQWKGSLQNGQGELNTASGALKNLPYSFQQRFGDAPGTNPEELVAAAHAGCFAMAMSAGLSQKGFEPVLLDVSATVSLEKEGSGWKVSASRLTLQAQVPGLDADEFKKIAEETKKNCPIAKLLNAEITLEARLATGSLLGDKRP